ncbi:spermidine hydroxycinnamoyl transferase-like [Chenopodium quinoa]|uniref:Uncharacterized protein n=1 Tax=Chenopodium quinoa TaxID=63459 RepID=A0A803LZ10_CHEQI|nr:spermidine hydroxycinnamoyl transferase-like [Chenopodium quinoa]
MRTISKHIVKPAEPTWNGLLPLTELDHISVITHSYIVYFYDKPIEHDSFVTSTNKIVNTLKNSLSRVLVPYYPLAGRLSWIGGGRFKLECNALGAELIEVESTMKIADFGDFYSSSDKFYNLLPEIDYCGRPIQGLPLLSVQITRFACGGLSVGLAMSHIVADGASAFRFIKNWARLTRGEPLEVVPLLDRRILLAEDADESSVREEVDDGGSMKFFSQVGLGKVGNNVTPIFKLLTKEKIERLKQVANNSNNDNNGHPYSRFEAITAYCVCKARQLKGEDITTLTIAIDARRRMDPPLPSSYFGNAVIDINVSSTAGEIMSKPLSYACSKIREATTKVNNKLVLELIDFLKSQQSLINHQFFEERGKQYSPPSPSIDHGKVEVISWLNLGCSGVDFGWGFETYMGPPMVHGRDGTFMITPFKLDGSMVVGLFLRNKSNVQFCELL